MLAMMCARADVSVAEANSNLQSFTLTTPAPINDHSTISNDHIEILKDIFAQSGYRLKLVYDSSAKALSTFKGGRYDAGIFVESLDAPMDGIRVPAVIESINMVFFTASDRADNLSIDALPANLRIASSALGKKVLSLYYPELLKNSDHILVSNPEHLFRLVKAQRADIGFSAKPLLFLNDEVSAQFQQLSKDEVNLELHIYLQPKHADLMPTLDRLLIENYQPRLEHFTNNR